MEQSTADTMASDIRDETFVIGEEVERYMTNNPSSKKTQLFSMLALLRAYVPKSYLLMAECQQVLGPPDPNDGAPLFEVRMEPFTGFITTSGPTHENVSMIDQICAQTAVELLTNLKISRSSLVEKLFSLCEDEPKPHLTKFIKVLLLKREKGEKGETEFSRLIEDILTEDVDQAFSVLETASCRFNDNPDFPQAFSRLSCTKRGRRDFAKAKEWAIKAIERAPLKSYVADTLGQVYKKRLRRQPKGSKEVLQMIEEALEAFKDVERKAEAEEGPNMEDTESTVSISTSFNNRGLFGFIQVANLAFDRLPEEQHSKFIEDQKKEVQEKFDFFEWYLTYSKLGKTTSEPYYFWRDVVRCYENYTEPTVLLSSSFPGLLRLLNHGLFIFKGTCAEFEDSEESVAHFRAIRRVLKDTYEKNDDDLKAAERYILSNIILSNRKPTSPQLTPVRDLQTIIHRFVGSDEGRRSPEFCLLVLMLFWPDEEVDQQATEDTTSDHESNDSESSEDEDNEDEDSEEEQETREEPAQQQPDLQQFATFMEEAYEETGYAKYLRGRYRVPLFFLGNGSGLSKWIHKSRLDVIVERKVDVELAEEQDNSYEMKMKRINDMWIKGEVWQVPEIQDILLPVQVEEEEGKMIVCIGGQKIKVKLDAPDSPHNFYLGFNIRGPVLFKVAVPDMSAQ